MNHTISPHGTFSAPMAGPLGRSQPKLMHDRGPTSVPLQKKHSAKSIQQFRRRCFPDT